MAPAKKEQGLNGKAKVACFLDCPSFSKNKEGPGSWTLTTTVLMKGLYVGETPGGLCCSSSPPGTLPYFRSVYLDLIEHPLLVKRGQSVQTVHMYNVF